ncbi:MAG: hypothetical protein AVDCRST_MAG73-1366 [uncultured Thermomicrobiales bacterium]|uniref:Uncharacterized protein n=1 Tax=uncultured Thermomicrobiales bacterium TaxID=1645740 RepID=A0A6J4TZE5_9BACT|nr:MAG: hypothetical protein AVDCRST_MAG73-1366 [uncultured Thermomicrobiales bacterium]
MVSADGDFARVAEVVELRHESWISVDARPRAERTQQKR